VPRPRFCEGGCFFFCDRFFLARRRARRANARQELSGVKCKCSIRKYPASSPKPHTRDGYVPGLRRSVAIVATWTQPLPFDSAQGKRAGLNCGAPPALWASWSLGLAESICATRDSGKLAAWNLRQRTYLLEGEMANQSLRNRPVLSPTFPDFPVRRFGSTSWLRTMRFTLKPRRTHGKSRSSGMRPVTFFPKAGGLAQARAALTQPPSSPSPCHFDAASGGVWRDRQTG
jgi:hypothetical protein